MLRYSFSDPPFGQRIRLSFGMSSAVISSEQACIITTLIYRIPQVCLITTNLCNTSFPVRVASVIMPSSLIRDHEFRCQQRMIHLTICTWSSHIVLQKIWHHKNVIIIYFYLGLPQICCIFIQGYSTHGT